MSRYISETRRIEVRARAKDCCEYCYSQEFFSPDTFSIDHILPYSKGGSHDEDNLALSCQGCNRRKYTHTEAKDPDTGKMAPLYNPRKDKWHKHFRWSRQFKNIIGISATGRATVAKLELNRKGVKNLRKVLLETRDHPPFPFAATK